MLLRSCYVRHKFPFGFAQGRLFASYVLPSSPSPCSRLSHALRTMLDKTLQNQDDVTIGPVLIIGFLQISRSNI